MLQSSTSERQGRVIDSDSGASMRQETGRIFLMTGRDVTADTLADYLALQAEKDTLRFITCGSVDDGKSTLIGRLLYESKMIFDDQLTALDSTAGNSALRMAGLISRCLSTGWPPSASRASPSMSLTAISLRTSGTSLSPTPRDMSNIHAIWRPVLPPLRWRSS